MKRNITLATTRCLFGAAVFALSLTAPVPAFSSNSEKPLYQQQGWTLPQAVNYALVNNPRIAIATQHIDAAAATVAATQGQQLPTIGLTAQYSQTNMAMHSFGNILNQGAFDNTIDFNSPGRTDALAVQAQAQYIFYDGGQTASSIQAAEALKETAQENQEVLKQQLAFEVVKAFHNIEQAKEMLQVRLSAVEALAASLDVGKARYDAGDLLKEDLLNLELQKVRAIEEKIKASHQLQLSKRIFWNLLGLKEEAEYTLPTVGQAQTLPSDFSYEKRKELAAVSSLIEHAQAQLNKAQGTTKPHLEGFGQYQFEHGTISGNGRGSWLAGVRLNYTLYDGKQRDHQITAAQAQLKAARAEKEQLRLTLCLEMQRARIAYQQALEKLQVTRKLVNVAQESSKLNRLRFQEGVILASDLINAETRLTDARARHATAKAELSIAIARLRKTAGLSQF